MGTREGTVEKGWSATMLVLLVATALFLYFGVASLHPRASEASPHIAASHFGLPNQAPNEILAASAPISGQAVFGQYCGVCHMDGDMGSPLQMPSRGVFVKMVREGHANAPGYSLALLSDAQIASLYKHMQGMASHHEGNRSGPPSWHHAPAAVSEQLQAIVFNTGNLALPPTLPGTLLGLQDESCVRCIGPPLA